MRHEKTFEAINKLKEVEIELHRLKNALEMTDRALEAKREWVGLTVDEIAELVCNLEDPENRIELGQKIEAKLKEKNNAI